MPYLHPKGAPKMIEFLKQAFAAEATAVHQSPDGVVQHATVRIGSSMIVMGKANGQWQPMPMTFMLYVDDVDPWYARVMKTEGMNSVSKPGGQAYGDLDEVYERAKAMNCMEKEDVHGADAGAIVKRPWGERSFYAEDPWGNGLCFVDEQTLFTGR